MIYPKNIKYYKLIYFSSETKIIKITDNWLEIEYNSKKYKINFNNILGLVMFKDVVITFDQYLQLTKVIKSIVIINSKYQVITHCTINTTIPELIIKQCQLINLNNAKIIVLNKISNQFSSQNSINLRAVQSKIDSTNQLHQLMLIEARCASMYFKNMFKDFGWTNRKPQLREDKINLLLDIGYFHLYLMVNALVISYGLIPNIGILHTNQVNKNSLSLDLMEVFRPIIDSVIINYLKKNLETEFRQDSNLKTTFVNFEDNKLFTSLINDELRKLKPKISKYIYNYRLFILGKSGFPIFAINKK